MPIDTTFDADRSGEETGYERWDLSTGLTCVGEGVANDTDEGDTWIPLAPFLSEEKEDLLQRARISNPTSSTPHMMIQRSTSSRNMLKPFLFVST